LINHATKLAVVTCVWLWSGTGYAQAQVDFQALLDNALACALTEQALADMPVLPLYHADQSMCEPGNPATQSALQWFADDTCTQRIDYASTRMSDYCEASLDKEALGGAVDIVESAWTLNPGNQLDVGAKRLDGVTQPYMQRRVFKTIATDRGECQLEMRIYSKHPAVSNQKAMIAFHGGSWTSRGFGFFGLELSIPHYVEQGFVVFAPFYRLLADRESTPACNQASFEQITSDAASALDWVLANYNDYGATGLPVLFGQSAGAHLAASLAVDRAETISAAVLMYPPTDFADFLLRVQQGFYTNAEGLSILERVINAPAAQVTTDDPLVYQNSFPLRIQNDNLLTAPMMIVHGMKDELVEPRQAHRLCQALASEPLLPTSQELSPVQGLVFKRDCGAEASMYLVREGNHALDVCLNDSIGSACPAGGKDSRVAVASVIDDAVNFALTSANASTAVSSGGSRSGGALSWQVLLVLFMIALLLRRKP